MLFVTTALMALQLAGNAWAAEQPIAVSSIEVRLFMADTGQFSEPVPEKSLLWNTIIGEGDAGGSSSSTLVKVLVSGPPGKFDKRATVSLKVAKPDSGERPAALNKSLGVFNAEGRQYVAFWLANTGCEELLVSARVGAGKSVDQTIPFKCGE